MNKSPIMILVGPQLAENIGMSARAMMNCNIEELRLVSPKEDHLSAKAISASSNAEEILYNAKVYSSTKEALADLDFVFAATARHRDQIKPIYNADTAAMGSNKLLSLGHKCGIMFGCERTGLSNADVSLADAIINIPLNPKHSSLNLSQAVLIIGYEFYKTQIEKPLVHLETNGAQFASKEKLFKFIEHFENLLSTCGNYNDQDKKEKLLINLQNIFTRNQMTEQELNTLYGAINYISKKN